MQEERAADVSGCSVCDCTGERLLWECQLKKGISRYCSLLPSLYPGLCLQGLSEYLLSILKMSKTLPKMQQLRYYYILFPLCCLGTEAQMGFICVQRYRRGMLSLLLGSAELSFWKMTFTPSILVDARKCVIVFGTNHLFAVSKYVNGFIRSEV